MARFKLDENLPAAAESLLRDAGHDVASVIQEELSGASDLEVHAAARAERRTVVTLDRGFGDPPRLHEERAGAGRGHAPGLA